MMWPKRNIKLLVPPNAEGLDGFQALLELLGLPYRVEVAGSSRQAPNAGTDALRLPENRESGPEDEGGKPGENGSSQGTEVAWWDEEIHKTGFNSSFLEGGCMAAVFTDLIVWPGLEETEPERCRARSAGMREIAPVEFLAETWQDEVLLPVFSPLALAGEKPLIWAILREAGFAPTLLWQDLSGMWGGEAGRGLGWVVPGTWLREIAGGERLGRQRAVTQVSWLVRPDRLDFYETSNRQEKLNYCGALPRWPEAVEETEACRSIAQALEMGVAWRDVRQALSVLWPEKALRALKLKAFNQIEEDQGCQANDFGRAKGPGGTQLPTQEHNNLEDRRAG